MARRIRPLPRECPQGERLDQSWDRRLRGLANEPRLSSSVDQLDDSMYFTFDCLRLGGGNRRLKSSKKVGDLARELPILTVFRFVNDPSIRHRRSVVRPDVLQQEYEAHRVFAAAIGGAGYGEFGGTSG